MSAETTCRFEELDRGTQAIALRPELNEVPWTDIERIGAGIVERVSNRDRPNVLIDLTELNHMGSAMVALVVRVWKAVTEKKGRMVVVNRNDLVAEVLEISGLANKWTIVETRDEAMQAFRNGGLAVGDGHSRAGLAFVVIAGLFLVLSLLALADAVATGLIAGSVGRSTLLWGATGIAIVALVLGIVGIRRSPGNLKLISAVIATLAAVATACSIFLALGGVQRIAKPDPAPAGVEEPESR